ncbi:MAG: cryptochrome/photolyase family protein [Gammaproteobacteria bacterium]|nr:cryptochrome/photolyase family protein [Gammaproteobacteria bacterium]
MTRVRRLSIVLGDQLNEDNPALRQLDPSLDLIWLCEASDEATQVPSHKARIVLFLSAMRHFAERLRARGLPVRYLALDQHPYSSLAAALSADLQRLKPQSARITHPGEHRLLIALRDACATQHVPVEVLDDDHFLCSTADFERWAQGRKTIRQEHFYRWMRKREQVLMSGAEPIGGAWNFDKSNRSSFGKQGPGRLPEPVGFPPDETTQAVIDLVSERFPKAPGDLSRFDWPVTSEQAATALEDFLANRLPAFGAYQDAMWSGQPFLYHARLSAALNLKLLNPRALIDAAVAAHTERRAPLESVEGFVRQVLGWREYVRGLYWREMPGYLERNALGAQQPLPAFYWDGETDAACLRNAIAQVLEYGYGHHIQRLMVTGLFALLLGVQPQAVHQWYLAMFVDAVEWVEAPNTLGMSQFADDGLLASKPYVASGAYIQRMSNYCRHCRFDPKQSTGERACPFTTLFWDFLAAHRDRFAQHPRTALMWRNLERLDQAELAVIRAQAGALRESLLA